MLNDSDLIPFEPPERLTLPALHRNFLESLPRSVYEQPATRIKGPLNDTLLICDPDLIHEMLVEKAELVGRSSITWYVFAPVLGESSVFVAEGADWQWRRRAVTSAFRHETLLSFVPVIAAISARQAERWRAVPTDLPIDVAAAMRQITFDIIIETLFGNPVNLDVDGYGRALTDAFEVTPWHTMLALFSAPAWTPFPGQRRLMRARRYLYHEIGRIVAERRAKRSTRPDMLDVLIAARDPESGRPMTDADVTNNLLTFISTGHEPSTVALAWALWLIAKDEDSQRRIFDETRTIAGENEIEAGHVERLTFTRQVIAETMRLYPPAGILLRQAKVDMTLGDHQIKAGTHLNVPIYALHRNVRLWNNPNSFDPDRFAPDRVKLHARYAYLPFGAGPRVCIGSSLAMIETAVILATLLRAFRFRPVPGHRPRPFPRISLRPRGGMPLFIEAR
jgi:cytochrome P450